MQVLPKSSPELVLVTGPSVLPGLAALKARAKALKKARKNEQKRFFSCWCAGFHALGFSF